MRVREIHFNHDRSSIESDAINLRLDATTLITAPEWVDGEPSKPAAYVSSALTGPITVKVRFSDGPPEASVEIAALADVDNRRPWLPEARQPVSDGAGGLKPRQVRFDSAGNSSLVTFEVIGDMSNAAIGIVDLKWTWCRRHANEWTEFASTRHRIYVLTARAIRPWTTAADETLGVFPWVIALEKACAWAAGATDEDQATDKIARILNSLSKQIYDESGTQFVVNTVIPNTNVFLLTDYLHELDNAPSFRIDCRGITTALTTFANLVGANLLPLVIDNQPPSGSTSGGSLHTKAVQPLTEPNFRERTWGWHEIALRQPLEPLDQTGAFVPGAATAVSIDVPVVGSFLLRIYDALLHLNSAAPQLPLRVPLGDVGTPNSGYLFEFIRSGTADRATPKATRPVV